MSETTERPRSRRALLVAAAGAAAATAATAALPKAVVAADPNDVVMGVDNPTTAQTSITQSTDGIVAFKARTVTTNAAGVVGSTGDETNIAPDTSWTGVYGWAPGAPPEVTNAFGSGVWGDSDDVGVAGTGSVGVRADGWYGVVAAGYVGGGVGLLAWGGNGSGTDVAIDVRGKAKFSRSGRSSIASGKASLRINLAGTTSSSRVLAVLHSNRTNRWVRAVVPTTGYFTIYLNAAVTSSTYVAWFVIN